MWGVIYLENKDGEMTFTKYYYVIFCILCSKSDNQQGLFE